MIYDLNFSFSGLSSPSKTFDFIVLEKCTVFLTAKAKEELSMVKMRLSGAIKIEASNIQLRIINEVLKQCILDEDKSIQELNLREDNVIFYVLKEPNIFFQKQNKIPVLSFFSPQKCDESYQVIINLTDNEWEDLEIESMKEGPDEKKVDIDNNNTKTEEE
ncbi:hypothetical protein RFI_24397 [Reticulomyxa filosa]|uniref:Uncharacterized protein n=1 Tax=Reticulomyxa filosa TaxID=46433 RepID=X6MG39_RETFI|nr:hypothetical protein RFI_24397 [Reticulomyxa filosa]|eukprot:ETO12978.1 hypothetical protein RFI_24397 [Reticulomyxa filosa]